MAHEAEHQLKQERLMLSGIEAKIQHALSSKISSRAETTLALRAAQQAKMWLGRALGAINVATPYAESFNPASKQIETRADHLEEVELPKTKDEIEYVKTLRAELNGIEKAIDNDSMILLENKKYQQAIMFAAMEAGNATMWLGMVLNAIRNETPSKAPKEEKQPAAPKTEKQVKKTEEKPASSTEKKEEKK